jgi:DNA-binding Lrp family transcriptional regulator
MRDQLDEIDKKMLKLLSKDGRISIKEMSNLLGLTPPAVKKRYDGLFKKGFIENTTVIVNLKKIGYNLSFYSMVKVSNANHSVDISTQLMKLDEISSVDIITGEYDIILKGAVTDQDHLFDLVSKIQAIPYVERLFTMIILKSRGDKLYKL